MKTEKEIEERRKRVLEKYKFFKKTGSINIEHGLYMVANDKTAMMLGSAEDPKPHEFGDGTLFLIFNVGKNKIRINCQENNQDYYYEDDYLED